MGMPCIGCYGPPQGVSDQGAALVAALGSMMDPGEADGPDGREIQRRVGRFMDGIPDLAGSCYRFSLAASLLGGRRQ